MGDVSTSGAYWIACRADKIIANPGTMTGSIGVIMQTQDLRGLYDKLGIDTLTFKSGPHKDMGAADRGVTDEERAIFQGMVDDIYNQFLGVVADGRKMEIEKVRKLADGRVYTGSQAKDLGLVDETGNYQDAISEAGNLSGLGPRPRVIELGPKGLWHEIFGSIIGSLPSGTNLLEGWPAGVINPSVWLVYPDYFIWKAGS